MNEAPGAGWPMGTPHTGSPAPAGGWPPNPSGPAPAAGWPVPAGHPGSGHLGSGHPGAGQAPGWPPIAGHQVVAGWPPARQARSNGSLHVPPVAIRPVAGTHYSLVIAGVPARVSGPAVASVVAGTISLIVAAIVWLFALVGANDGWGPAVAGAFAILSTVSGTAGLVLGVAGSRQVRRSVPAEPAVGKAAAIVGLIVASLGTFLGVAAMAVAFLVVR